MGYSSEISVKCGRNSTTEKSVPYDITQNGGFGRHTISTHEHNGHHGAENDGFTGAYFFPNQFYDYHYPIVLAGRSTINTTASETLCISPDIISEVALGYASIML